MNPSARQRAALLLSNGLAAVTAKVEAALLKLGPIDDLDEQAQLDLLIGAIRDLEAAYEALSGRKWKWADRAG